MTMLNFDYDILRHVCQAEIKDFNTLGDVTDTAWGQYIYINNNAKVLAVAHLDTVLGADKFKVHRKKKDTIILSEVLDDRLGAFAILYMLPQLGIECDILLTEGEERGQSTGAYFTPPEGKEYNWIFSFDRRGDDVVLYQYESKSICDSLESSGFRIGIGSFSDIAFMDFLNVKGFNVGTGYYGEHTKQSYARINVLKAQLMRFKEFYDAFKDVKFPHDSDADY